MKLKNQSRKNVVNYPSIIYGTSFLGNLYRELTENEKITLMQEWFRVTNEKVMIDTAGKYGAGLALEVIRWGLDKLDIEPEQITISNKLGWYRIPLKTKKPTFEPGIWSNLQYDAVQKISYNGILDCWKQGCELLGNRYKPELVSVHDPDEYVAAATSKDDRKKRLNDILEAYKALFDLKEKGEVKAVGIGSKDWIIIKELHNYISFDWVMFANKFTIYHHPQLIVDFMKQLNKEGVVIINSAIFNAGFLTGGEYFDYRKLNPENPIDQELLEWRDRFFTICKKHNVEPGDACLKFALSAPQINAIALNPSKPERMANNKLVIAKKLPKAFWNELKSEKVIDYNYL
jgi:D-threo-aldose 1-dehydrogenase